MKKKLFKVSVVNFEFVVAVDDDHDEEYVVHTAIWNQTVLEGIGSHLVTEITNDTTSYEIQQITTLDDLPWNWNGDCMPLNQDGSGATISEILDSSAAHEIDALHAEIKSLKERLKRYETAPKTAKKKKVKRAPRAKRASAQARTS